MLKVGCLVIVLLMLSGCYSNWEQLDSFAKQFDCDTTKSQAIALAKQQKTSYEWDESYLVLSIVKEEDAIAIQFIPESYGSSIIRLDTVSKVKSHITFLGLDRSQGDTELVIRCDKDKKMIEVLAD